MLPWPQVAAGIAPLLTFAAAAAEAQISAARIDRLASVVVLAPGSERVHQASVGQAKLGSGRVDRKAQGQRITFRMRRDGFLQELT
jgi:hypothetical protein